MRLNVPLEYDSDLKQGGKLPRWAAESPEHHLELDISVLWSVYNHKYFV